MNSRSISLCAKIKLLFVANVNAFVAGIFLLVGLIMSAMMVAPCAADLFANWKHAGEAVVRSVDRTNANFNDNDIFAYRFFRKNQVGADTSGITYQFKEKYAVNQTVPVLSCQFLGEKWKLEGGAFSFFGQQLFFVWIFLFVVLLFVVGAFALWFLGGFLLGLKRLRLMANGEIGEAVFLESHKTSVQVNMKSLVKLLFRFQAKDGQEYTATVYTTRSDEMLSEPPENFTVFYNPNSPDKNYIPSSLKGLKFDEDTNVFTYSFLHLLPSLLLVLLFACLLGFIFSLVVEAAQNGKIFGHL